jgi:hypothetical protein
LGPGQYPAARLAWRTKPRGGKAKVGGWTETRPVSLGLLPSGPDPVGEWCVHRQPPSIYLDRSGEFRNRLERLIQAARASPARGPRGLRRGIKTKLSCFPRRGDPVKGSFRDKACEKAVVPCGGIALETHGALAGARSSRRRIAKDHIHHPGQTAFHPERARTSGPSAPASNANGVN